MNELQDIILDEKEWKEIQRLAKESIKNKRHIGYWKSIADGKIPFGYKIKLNEKMKK